MELIKLTPSLGVDPSLRLRSPGEVLLHDYMRPEAMNPAQLARRAYAAPCRVLASRGFICLRLPVCCSE